MPDLGRKHICFKCGSKFYDLKKPKALCPKCGADQADAPSVPVAAQPSTPAPQKRGPKMVDPVEEALPEEPLDDEEGADDADLDLEGGDEDVGVEEDLDEPAGEDSFD